MKDYFVCQPRFKATRVEVTGKVNNRYTDNTVAKIYHPLLQPGNGLSDYARLVWSSSKRLALERAEAQRRAQRRRAQRRCARR